jgi:hypothetical protein
VVIWAAYRYRYCKGFFVIVFGNPYSFRDRKDCGLSGDVYSWDLSGILIPGESEIAGNNDGNRVYFRNHFFFIVVDRCSSFFISLHGMYYCRNKTTIRNYFSDYIPLKKD